MSKKFKIHQFLRESGLFNNRADLLQALEAGKVKIGDHVVKNPEYQFKTTESVFYKNKKMEKPAEHTYILLHKPVGYLCHKISFKRQIQGRKSVFSVLPPTITQNDINKLTCVGRLDEETSGLLIFTTDGKLNHLLTDPKHAIPKTYRVRLEHSLILPQKNLIETGITIELEEDGIITKYKTKPCQIRMLNQSNVEITIYEGKKREIRRIFEAVDNYVEELQRIKIGNLQLKEEVPAVGTIKYVTKQYILKNVLPKQ